MKSIIFIHAALLLRCNERISQYIDLINTSGLYSEVEKIIICFVGSDNIPDKIQELSIIYTKIVLHRVHTDLKEYENSTLNIIHLFCKLHNNYNVLYLHTKNVGKTINICIEDQIEYMLHFLINKWKSTVKHLETYQTAGVDLRDYPVLHYSGNFWWANSEYIAKLPCPMDFKDLIKYPNPLNSERHNQEFWICSDKSGSKHISVWDCGINCYQRHLHRYEKSNYI